MAINDCQNYFDDSFFSISSSFLYPNFRAIQKSKYAWFKIELHSIMLCSILLFDKIKPSHDGIKTLILKRMVRESRFSQAALFRLHSSKFPNSILHYWATRCAEETTVIRWRRTSGFRRDSGEISCYQDASFKLRSVDLAALLLVFSVRPGTSYFDFSSYETFKGSKLSLA